MVRYKLKTRYISRAKLLALLKKNHPDMHDSEFRIVMRNDVLVYSAPTKLTDEEVRAAQEE